MAVDQDLGADALRKCLSVFRPKISPPDETEHVSADMLVLRSQWLRKDVRVESGLGNVVGTAVTSENAAVQLQSQRARTKELDVGVAHAPGAITVE
jgi:hypothetical protein